MRRPALLMLSALVLALASPAGAQERESAPPRPGSPAADTLPRADLPPGVADEIVEFFNDPRTLHFGGGTRIPEERVITGNVAVLGGPLVVAGTIEGRVVVINGSVQLLPGASIRGDLTVVGGEVEGADEARLGGEVAVYSERLRYRRYGERIGRAGVPRSERAERGGRSTFLVTTGQSYNRVEGLPVVFGPVIRTAGRNPFRVSAQAIFRTEFGSPFHTGRWGHQGFIEQSLHGRQLRVGVEAYSRVDPIEEWHLSDTENGLSTLLFHEDFRDHYDRKGWGAYVVVEPRETPLSFLGRLRSERHASLPAGSPFSVWKSGEEWRPQPLVGEGRLNSVIGSVRLDTRNDREDPSAGWFVRGEVERALSSGLARPGLAFFGATGSILPETRYDAFTVGMLDLRRYNRISPEARLNFRVLVGGSLGGGPLPPQRQHALGGEGSLPGYPLFAVDCGARRGTGAVVGRRGAYPFHAAYGCDRFALLQAEYRGRLAFRFDGSGDGDEEEGAHEHWGAELDWVTFVDVGRGWAGRGAEHEDTAVDAGMGLLFDRVGVYAAVPLRRERGVSVFVRLGPRF